MNLIRYPNPSLLARTQEIKAGEIPDLEDRIQEMFQIMYQSNGVGLAAPQVDWNVKLCVINPTSEPGEEELVLINPKITGSEGKESGEEGCLSFPGIYVKVSRSETLEVQYQDRDLQPTTLKASGFLARVIQHELDHLNGILLIHRMSETDKFVNRKKLKELKEAASA